MTSGASYEDAVMLMTAAFGFLEKRDTESGSERGISHTWRECAESGQKISGSLTITWPSKRPGQTRGNLRLII